MSVQKTPLWKTYEMSVGSDSINVKLWVRVDNLIGLKFLSLPTKVTNIRRYTTSTTLSLHQQWYRVLNFEILLTSIA